MPKSQSYLSATLLWIDDNFGNREFLKRRTTKDIDFWREIFGGADSRLFRLFNLSLELVATYEDALQVLAEHTNEEKNSCYLTAIVDLRIPKSIKNFSSPELKFGIDIAKKLRAQDIQFYFLSSSSSSVSETLAQDRLETIPYYQKQSDDTSTLIPESLAHAILNDFRNKISWIDLKPIMSMLSDQSGYADVFKSARSFKVSTGDSTGLAGSFLPFFGGFRDFVERWEYKPPSTKWQTLVMRAPTTHSDIFLQQCIMIMIHTLLRRRRLPTPLHFFSLNGDVPTYEQLERDPVVSDMGNICVFRAHKEDSCSVSPSELAKLVRSRRAGLSIVILPADDTADRYLDALPHFQNVYFDDFPTIRQNDSAGRSELIQRAAEFVFQQSKVNIDEQGARSLASLYARNPQLLIHPVFWTFLNEAEEVADEISDPYEILDVLAHVANGLDDLPIKAKYDLVEGRPLAIDQLLKVAADAYLKRSNIHERWQRKALHDWLSTSWHVPHGCTDVYGDEEEERQKEMWENHALTVLIDLASTWNPEEDLSFDSTPEMRDLLAAKNFLAHPGIARILQGSASPEVWKGLETLRWPHTRYPMPVALSRRLKEEGRYLWVQSDFLDQTLTLRSGRMLYQDLDNMAWQYHMRLDWIETVAEKLPASWGAPLLRIRDTITKPNLTEEWQDQGPAGQEARNQAWLPLFALLSNAMPISLLYFHLLDGRPITDNNSVKSRLLKSKGFGTILGQIRGIRENAEDVGLRPNSIWRSPWDQHLGEIASLSKYYMSMEKAFKDWQETGNNKKHEFPNIQILDMLSSIIASFAKDFETFRGTPDFSAEKAIASMLSISNKHQLNSGDWFVDAEARPEVEGVSYKTVASLLATRGDYIWSYVDLMSSFKTAYRPLRYFDGYHLLSAIGDLRNSFKGRTPGADFPYDHIEKVHELALWGLEGIVAQLKYCLDCAGHTDLAASIPLVTLDVTIPPKKVDGIDEIFKIVETGSGQTQIYTIGIHGSATVDKFSCLDEKGEVHILNDAPKLDLDSQQPTE